MLWKPINSLTTETNTHQMKNGWRQTKLKFDSVSMGSLNNGRPHDSDAHFIRRFDGANSRTKILSQCERSLCLIVFFFSQFHFIFHSSTIVHNNRSRKPHSLLMNFVYCKIQFECIKSWHLHRNDGSLEEFIIFIHFGIQEKKKKCLLLPRVIQLTVAANQK